MDYLTDPAEIYRRSFAAIEAEADLARLPEPLRPLAVRVVHASGMPDVADDLVWGGDAATAGRRALDRGAVILCDARMVAEGVIARRLPGDNPVLCLLDQVGADPVDGRGRRTTRSAVAVELWTPYLDGAVVAIGNAPTALFRLLELLEEGAPRPAAIFGFPVGFVGAAESKQALAEIAHGVPFLTLSGRRGGSAMASAAVNALMGNGS